MAALNILAQVLVDLHRAGGAGAAVGGDGHEVHGAFDVHMAHQVGHKDEAAFQHADKDGVLVPEVLRDFSADLRHLGLNFLFTDEDTFNIVAHSVYLLYIILLPLQKS